MVCSVPSLSLLLLCCCQLCQQVRQRMEATTPRSHHADKVSVGVPQPAPHGNDTLWSPLSHAVLTVSWLFWSGLVSAAQVFAL